MHFFDKKMEEKIPGTPAYNEKRNERMKKNNIFIMNKRLQSEIRRLRFDKLMEDDLFRSLVEKANRRIQSSTVLQLGYVNNFENEEVVIDSIEFIYNVLNSFPERDFEYKMSVFQETKRIKNEFFNFIIYRQIPDINLLEREVEKKIRQK